MNNAGFQQGTSVGMAIRGMDVEVYSKVDGTTTYYAFAPMGTSINTPKWNLMKLFDDGTTMRKGYPLSPEKFSDYNQRNRTSERFDAFDPTDPATYTLNELSFSAEYEYKGTVLDTAYYSDIMDSIVI